MINMLGFGFNEFLFYAETLVIAKQKAKRAMYVSDIEDDQTNRKKQKSSIECPIFQGA